jgi:TldD protein
MTDSPFRPFETHLDRDTALNILKNTLIGADDGELFLERCRSEVISFDDGRLRTSSFDASEGFGLRAVQGETVGYAHSTEVSEQAMRRATGTVRLAIGAGGGSLAAAPQATNQKLYSDHNPLSDSTFPAKIDILREIDAYARGLDRRVVQASATIAASHQEVVILRLDAPDVSDSRPMVRMNVSIIVEQDGQRQTGYVGGGGRYGLNGMLEPTHWQPLVREALRIAVVNLLAIPAPAGIMDVALGAGWPGILLHEAIGHGLEGDFNRKGTSAFAGLMGQRIAAPGVTVLDDGTMPNRRGSITVDDEGTPSGKNTLIEDGILVGFMQDRQNARLMGVPPTGNGRRQSFAHTPMPRMTNTYMLGGSVDPKDMVADIKDGIYAVGFGGGQVDITNGKFVFSCTEAYLVKDGKVAAPVKGATLIGDGATALQKIRAIGNDMRLDDGMGNCGKQGQWVPVGVGQPSLLIGGLTVGGSAT